MLPAHGRGVVGWMAAAHIAEGALLIRQCVENDPAIAQTAGSRHGDVRLWARARLSDDSLSLAETPLGAMEWGSFANPSFCGPLTAYWGFANGGRLTARIFDVASGTQVAARQIGTVALETDISEIFARPRWNDDCSRASFTAEPFISGTWTLP